VEDRRIVQGDVFWVDVGDPDGSSPGYPRPYVIVQNNLFNRSGIRTVVTCALTSNLRRAGDPGNVLLVPGEAGLPEQSVVNVSQVLTVDKRKLGDRIGSLSGERVREVVSAIELLSEPRDTGG
jgi:mRNA interferase MazF